MNEKFLKRLVENYELRIECDDMDVRYGIRGWFEGYFPTGETKVFFVPLPEDFEISDVDDETGEVALSEATKNTILFDIFKRRQVVECQNNMTIFKATIVDKLSWSERLTLTTNNI